MRIALLSLAALAVAGCAQTDRNTSLPTQSDVDLNRYAGTWYEQARLPNRFQDQCVGDVRADYVLQADNRLKVTNQCRTAGGETDVAVGEGRPADADAPNPAQLEVRFAPSWLSWLPSVWGDYWIITTDYKYSLVGTPDRKHLWVLSREQQADQARVDQLLKRADSLGFDVDSVITTEQ